MRKILIALALTAGAMAKAQTEVAQYQPGVTVEGVTYFLPQTALRITVEARKTVVRPGRLNKYAFRYLRLQDVPREVETSWEMTGVTVEPYGVADKTKGYSIRLKSRTLAPLVSLTHDGLLLSINATQEETPLKDTPQNIPATTPVDATRYLNQEMLAAGSTAKMAELCAQEIYDLRENRKDLISGQADNTPKDGAQLQLMLSQLDQQAEALEQLFSGTREESTEYFTFDVLPTQTNQRQVVFRFSTTSGPVAADNLLGSPVYLTLKDLDTLPPSTPSLETDKKRQKMDQGVWYNVPARQNVVISDLSRTWADMDVPMGQFGYTEVLGEALFDKKATTKAYFYQANGGLQKLEQ